MRRAYSFAASLAALAIAAGALPAPAAASEKAAARPNVLFIAVDDLNHWVGHLGRNKQTITPNIDRLAKLGVSFSRAYCAAPVCNPSRTALMSGRRPGETGIYDNGSYWRQAVPEEQTLEYTFRKAGYKVSAAGKIYHGDAHAEGYWDESLGKHKGDPKTLHPSAKNDGVGGIKFAPLDAADADLQDHSTVDYALQRLAAEKTSQPFFLAVGLHKPHMPWNVPKKYYDMHPLDSIELPPNKPDDLDDVPAGGLKMAKPDGDHAQILASGRWKEAVQGYLAAISYCDAEVGRLLEAYEKSPTRAETVVVFWGDHGWHLGEKRHWRKFALWEESTRAPLIWIAPGVTTAGTTSARTVDHMSIYPTLCDLCGVPTPEHVRGPSLRPLLVDPNAKWDRPAVTTFGRNNHAVRSETHRYIRYADGGEELYDETADPYEWKNLAADPALVKVKAELAKSLPAENEPERPAGGKGENRKAAKKADKSEKADKAASE